MDRPTVLTITPNPSLDLLHETDRIVWDDANRVAPPRRRAGGQGVNVARAMLSIGGTAVVVAPFGGRTGDELVDTLRAEGIPCRTTKAPGETRIFSAIRETSTSRSLLINSRGQHFTAADIASLSGAISDAIDGLRPAWVACCGSLPPGFQPDFYDAIRRVARKSGARFVADCDGEPLRLAAVGPCDLLVPNRYEAERLTGRPVTDVATARAAAAMLVAGGAAVAIITLGAAGAVMATPDLAMHAVVAPLADGAAVGAGDSLLAGVLLGLDRGVSPVEALRMGVAAGTAVLSGAGADLVDRTAYRDLLPLVSIVELVD